MKKIDLRMDKTIYKFIEKSASASRFWLCDSSFLAAALNSSSFQFEVMINGGITVYWKRRQYEKQSDQIAVDVCNHIIRSKIKLRERESGFFESLREEYKDEREMFETLRSKSASWDKNHMNVTIELTDGLADYLQKESVSKAISMSILIQHHLEEYLMFEILGKNQRLNEKWYPVLNDLICSRSEFNEKNNKVQITRPSRNIIPK